MGSNSVLKIKGDLLTQNANSGYGFRGIGTEYAVVQAARIYHEGNEQFRMSYYGKLLVATQNHFDQWYKDAPNTNQPAYWYESSVKFTKDGDNIATITATDCNPGYEGDGGNESYTYRVIVEDLSADQGSDFDFNDLVFDVDPDEDGNGATIKILAAGGIWPLTINGDEVHGLLIPGIQKTNKYTINGDEYECYPMINTCKDDDEKGVSTSNQPTIHVTGNYSTDEKCRESINAISLVISKYDGSQPIELYAIKGKPACKMLVDQDFPINSEYESLVSKDNKNKFKEYVAGKFVGRWWINE